MKMYKLGCNWGPGAPFFYDLLNERSIVIGDKSTKYSIGDLVLVSKGHDVIALAVVKSLPKASTNFKNLEAPFKKFKIDYVDRVEVYDCEFFALEKQEIFTYKLQQGIREVQKGEIKEKALKLLEIKYKTEQMNEFKNLLKQKKQIILQGPPGTGKTFMAKDIAKEVINEHISNENKEEVQTLENSDQFEIIQFHPSYTYEDFVRGIVVESENGNISYKTVNKVFAKMASEALKNEEDPYILIIDEINRANLPSVLGELIYGLEYRGEAVDSMYALDDGDNKITIPENLYIIGTMNTADRSVGHIDYAIRRRFAFVEMLPKILKDSDLNFRKDKFEDVSDLFVKEIKTKSLDLEASKHLSPEFEDRPQDVWLGHSYFIEQKDEQGNPIDFQLRVQYEIIPILEEYMKDGILQNTDEVKDIINGLKKD